MSWYSNQWTRRRKFTVSQNAGSTTIDVELTVPKEDDEFWNNVLASGNDIRATSADGITLVSFDLNSFNTTTRAGTIELDNVTAIATGTTAFWLYWGNSAATSGTSSFVPASPVTAQLLPAVPLGPWYALAQVHSYGDTSTKVRISKAPLDKGWLAVDCTNLLYPNIDSRSGSRAYEEVASFQVTSVESGASTKSATYDNTKGRAVGNVIMVWLTDDVTGSGWTSGSNYAVYIQVTTTLDRVFNLAVAVDCQKVTE